MKKKLGVVGGGQLCLMMGEAIWEKNLPYDLIAVDPHDPCPASAYLTEHIVGDYKDEQQIRTLAAKSDVITFEIELANSTVLQELSDQNFPVHPSPQTLKILQDKYDQATFLQQHGLPLPAFQNIETRTDLAQAINDLGLPLMLKARRDSYDGRGNFTLKTEADIDKALAYFEGRALMAQQFIPFDLEVSVICARSVAGEVSAFPVGENIHGAHYNILETTIVPARIDASLLEKAQAVATSTLEALQGAGVFGIEMFVRRDEILINEIAPRVHNSGHYTIEGCQTSQFEQQVRAVTGMELGPTDLVSDFVIMKNIVGAEGYTGIYEMHYDGQIVTGTVAVQPGVVIHNYGKTQTRPWRKLGHVTLASQPGETQDELLARATSVYNKITLVPTS